MNTKANSKPNNRTPLIKLDKVSVQAPTSSNLLKRPSSEAHTLVKQVSAELNSGEVLAIIGPNGAGKSTLVNAIAGDLDYTGTIEIQGLESDAKLRARQMAVLPQLSLLNFAYKVSEVVELARIPHASGKKRDRQIVQEALNMMDIGYLSDRLYTELSGGEKQRVQLARVFAQLWQADDAANGTRVLLLDEPTAALDLGHQHQLMQAIVDFAQQGVAVVMVLHDLNLAARYADTALAMLCSERLAHGRVDEVITKKNIKALFGIDVHITQHPDHQSPVVIGL